MAARVFIYIFLIINFSCKSSKNINEQNMTTMISKLLEHSDISQWEEIPLQGIDSKVGLFINGTDTIHYDMGHHSYKGPIGLYSYFQTTFKSYHYSNFFRLLKMDEKVYDVYRNEVSITGVSTSNQDQSKWLKTCDNCNAVGELIFKEQTFFYPFTAPQKVLDVEQDHNIVYYKDKNHQYKYFKSKDQCGLVISPTDQSNKKRITLMDHSPSSKSCTLLEKLRAKENILN